MYLVLNKAYNKPRIPKLSASNPWKRARSNGIAMEQLAKKYLEKIFNTSFETCENSAIDFKSDNDIYIEVKSLDLRNHSKTFKIDIDQYYEIYKIRENGHKVFFSFVIHSATYFKIVVLDAKNVIDYIESKKLRDRNIKQISLTIQDVENIMYLIKIVSKV